VGSKINIIPATGELWVDIRFLPGEDKASLREKIRTILGSLYEELEITFDDFHLPNLSSKETPLYKAISEIFSEAHPEADLVPSLIGGVTDGRYWRPRGRWFTASTFSRKISPWRNTAGGSTGLTRGFPSPVWRSIWSFLPSFPRDFGSIGKMKH
jgi:hypothetical protein